MHFFSIPRHRMELRWGDYARIIRQLVWSGDPTLWINRLERSFADYVGCRHALAVPSGRMGLHLVISQLGLSSGDEVIVPAFNLFAVIDRFRHLGLVPRFCDIRLADLNIDAAAAARCITPKTRALLITHMYGHPADMTALCDLARRHNLIVLEDCAHSLGSRWEGRCVGTFGKASIFSFSVLKLATTFGGGMVATNDANLAQGVRETFESLRNQRSISSGMRRALTGAVMDLGTRRWPFSVAAWPTLRAIRAARPGFQKEMMTETPCETGGFPMGPVAPLHAFQAGLGVSQIHRCEEMIAHRRQVCRWLDEALNGIPGVALLRPDNRGRRNGLYYGVLVDRPEELSQYLFARGIDSETSEYRNCAGLDSYRDFAQTCPIADRVDRSIVRLPNYPSLSHRDVQRIADAIRTFQTGTVVHVASAPRADVAQPENKQREAVAVSGIVDGSAQPRSERRPSATAER